MELLTPIIPGLYRVFCELEPSASRDAQAFVKFCDSYLAAHRPMSVSHDVEANLRFSLSNGKEFVLSPPCAGSANSLGYDPARARARDLPYGDSVPITGGDLPHRDLPPSDSYPITGV